MKATLADISGVILAGKYTYQPVTLYGGYEFAVFMPPSDNYPGGFGTLGGYNVLPGAVNSTAYIDNKHLQVAWVGAKYAVRSDLDISGAYYIAHQNDYRPPGAKSTVCGPNTEPPFPARARKARSTPIARAICRRSPSSSITARSSASTSMAA